MVPDGVTVVAALHTVSAPELADPDADLDEDVLICGDRKADKAKVARLIEAIAGLRAVNAGAARDGADRRAADADADLDQRPLQGPRRDPDHRPARRRPLGSEHRDVALLAGGTGGAKLAAGLQDLVGDRPRGDRRTPPTTSRSTASTSPPTPTWSPTGSPARSTRSAAGASTTTPSPSTSGSSSSARPAGSGSPTATSRPASTAPTSSPRAGP